MMDIISVLYEKMCNVITEKLQLKHIIQTESGKVDVLATLLTSPGSVKTKESIFIESAMLEFELSLISQEEFEFAKEHGLIIENSDNQGNTGYFISYKGIAKYSNEQMNIVDSIAYLDSNFSLKKLSTIKNEEKVIILYLLALGAIGEENRVDTNNWDQTLLETHFQILQMISEKAHEYGVFEQINWSNRKNRNYRMFFSNTNVLPKTHLFSASPRNTYYLVLTETFEYKKLIKLLYNKAHLAYSELHILNQLVDDISLTLQIEFAQLPNVHTFDFTTLED